MQIIPHVIHYCWFGKKKIPDENKRYMMSWKEHCPDYQIKEWNEENFNINANQYCAEAYAAKQWAFVSDYARLKIIYEEGGIYLDTDVEVLKDLSPLIDQGIGFIGFQNSYEATTGLGFAAAPYNPVVKAMLDIYTNRHFINLNGEYNKIPCPAANTVALLNCGMKNGRFHSRLIQKLNGINVYPEEFFNPFNRDIQLLKKTENTYTIHHYTGSWCSKNAKQKAILKRLIPNYYLLYRVDKIARHDIKKIQEEIENKEESV